MSVREEKDVEKKGVMYGLPFTLHLNKLNITVFRIIRISNRLIWKISKK